MKWLGDKPFHSFLLLTERPGDWPVYLVVLIPIALAASAALVWATTLGNVLWAVGAGLVLLAFSAADGAWLVSLPRRGLSFGAPQPPLLALALLRWLLLLVTMPLVARWPAPTLGALALIQFSIWGMLVYGTAIEPFLLPVTHLRIELPSWSNPGTSLRIVQLSDLHVERLTRRERILPALVNELEPDLVVLTGDYLSTSYNTDPRARQDLGKLLAQIQAPCGVYAIWGTPEVDHPSFLRDLMTDLGIVLLEDQAKAIPVGDRCLWLMGVNTTTDLEVAAARLDALLNDMPTGATSILLHHLPDLMPQASEQPVDLYLAGHTHGGQWRVPGFGALLTSSRFWKRYESGYYREGKTHLYVSRGLGMEGFGTPRARFFCPPEIVALTLSGPAAHGQTRPGFLPATPEVG